MKKIILDKYLAKNKQENVCKNLYLSLRKFFLRMFFTVYVKNIYTLKGGSTYTLIYPYIFGHLAPHVSSDIPFQNFSRYNHGSIKSDLSVLSMDILQPFSFWLTYFRFLIT
jgi:hypothetical protein